MKVKFSVFCFVLAAIAVVMVERLFEFNDRISRLEREGSAQRQFNYWVTTNVFLLYFICGMTDGFKAWRNLWRSRTIADYLTVSLGLFLAICAIVTLCKQ